MLSRRYISLGLFVCIIYLCSCNNNDEVHNLVASGIYKDCLELKISEDESFVINNDFNSDKKITLCKNSNVKVLDKANKVIDEFFYFFEDNNIDYAIIENAIALWYNKPSFYLSGNDMYMSFVDSVGNVKIASYRSGEPIEINTVHRFNVGDDHSAPSITMNEFGNIILLFSYHSSPLFIAKSNLPNDITSFTVNSIDSEYITYPSVFKLDDGTLLAFFRKGMTGEQSKGEYHKIKSYDGGNTWSKSEAVISFDPKYITYGLPKIINNTIYIAYSQLDRDDNRYKGVYLTFSTDNGETWSAKNEKQTFLDENTSKLLVNVTDVRVSDITVVNDEIYVAYNVFKNGGEFNCCDKENEIFIHSVGSERSYFIGNGRINYYSDGLIFDENYPRLSYYIRGNKKNDNSDLVIVENTGLNDVKFNEIGVLVLPGNNNMRLESMTSNNPLSLKWISANNYSSYNDFSTNILFTTFD